MSDPSHCASREDAGFDRLPILYRDDWLVAVDKPPGLLVHRSGLDAGETRFALQILRNQLGQPVWPLHRLDKGTSGVLVFALDAVTAGLLSTGSQAGEQAVKTYRAIVRGWPPAEGSIDHLLKRLADDARAARQMIQPARTRFRTLEHLVRISAIADGDFNVIADGVSSDRGRSRWARERRVGWYLSRLRSR